LLVNFALTRKTSAVVRGLRANLGISSLIPDGADESQAGKRMWDLIFLMMPKEEYTYLQLADRERDRAAGRGQ